jgi:hypothetical protein
MRLFLLLALVGACATNIDTDTDTDTDVVDTDTDLSDEHPCDQAAREAAERDIMSAWQPTWVAACYDGCSDAEASVGYDQGRLARILGGEFCPRCVGDLNGAGEHYAIGYVECYARVYTEGWVEAGCAT